MDPECTVMPIWVTYNGIHPRVRVKQQDATLRRAGRPPTMSILASPLPPLPGLGTRRGYWTYGFS
jgi:hypothetical protein